MKKFIAWMIFLPSFLLANTETDLTTVKINLGSDKENVIKNLKGFRESLPKLPEASVDEKIFATESKLRFNRLLVTMAGREKPDITIEEAIDLLVGTPEMQKPFLIEIVMKALNEKGFTRPIHPKRAERLENSEQAKTFLKLISESQTGAELNKKVSDLNSAETWARSTRSREDLAFWFPPPKVGELLPKIQGIEGWINAQDKAWAQGDSLDLTTLKGKPVLIEFWATWCPPCQVALIETKDLYREYQDKLEIIGIMSFEGDATVQDAQKAVKKREIQFTNIFVNKNSLTNMAFGVFAIPSSFLIDADGKIIAEGNPLNEDFQKAVKDFLKKQD